MPNKSAFDSIKRGLREAVEHAKGRAPATRIHRARPVNVEKGARLELN